MEKLAKPQIVSHIEKSLDYSLFDVKWLPCSAKFVVMGSRPRGTGLIQIYEVSSGALNLVKSIERSNSIKCGTFKASSLRDRFLATGDFKVSDSDKYARRLRYFSFLSKGMFDGWCGRESGLGRGYQGCLTVAIQRENRSRAHAPPRRHWLH